MASDLVPILAYLHLEPLYNEQISFIVSKDHDIALKLSLSLEELYEYPLISNCKDEYA